MSILFIFKNQLLILLTFLVLFFYPLSFISALILIIPFLLQILGVDFSYLSRLLSCKGKLFTRVFFFFFWCRNLLIQIFLFVLLLLHTISFVKLYFHFLLFQGIFKISFWFPLSLNGCSRVCCFHLWIFLFSFHCSFY